jgi:hypothetical protein
MVMTMEGLSEGVVVSSCFDCKPACSYEFTMVHPSQRVVGCNKYDGTQIFETDGVISLASRYKFVDRPDIKETSSIMQRVINREIRLTHTAAVCAVLACFVIGMISFSEGSMMFTILATLAGLGFLVYVKKLEEHLPTLATFGS